jgi:hypothetical protein
VPQGHTDKMLSPIRRAIDGWGFCDRQTLMNRIKAANMAKAKLARTMRGDADALIEPLRRAVRRMQS